MPHAGPACAQRAVVGFVGSAPSGSLARPRPFVLGTPVSCRLTTQGPAIADLFCTLPMINRLDGVNIEFSTSSVQETIRLLNSLSAMSFMMRSCVPSQSVNELNYRAVQE